LEDHILQVNAISKAFPGVQALDHVSFQVKRGEIHALVGENGAGKSTLIKVLCGVHPYGTYSGELFYDGEIRRFHTISEVEQAGIACIHQELSLCPDLSVWENIFLGKYIHRRGKLNFEKMHRKTQELLVRIGVNNNSEQKIDPDALVGTLGIGYQQMVEIAKALATDVKLLILDEPTAALTDKEADVLLEILEDLRSNGITCIYISHRLDEVMRIADTITIIRDGHSIETRPKENMPREDMVKLMVGRELKSFYPREKHDKRELMLEIENYSVEHPEIKDKYVVENVSFKAYAGEILGFCGLVGAGRTELFSSIYGVYNGKAVGSVNLRSKPVHIKTPLDALNNGIFLVSEDRKRYGLNLLMSIKENATLASLKDFSRLGILNESKEIAETTELSRKLRVRANNAEVMVGTLSGGNQQKVVLEKALLNHPAIIILDEPTRGIDVGAKYEIYTIMNQLIEEGVTVIMISSDMEEILGMSDRILTMYNGRISGEFAISEATPEKLMHAATGRSE